MPFAPLKRRQVKSWPHHRLLHAARPVAAERRRVDLAVHPDGVEHAGECQGHCHRAVHACAALEPRLTRVVRSNTELGHKRVAPDADSTMHK
jgi:hypothetical protein